MDLQTILLATIPAVVSIAVAWGIIRTEVSVMKETISELKKHVETMTTKESCQQQHRHNDKTMSDLQSDLREIKTMLYRIIEKMGGE